MTFTPPEPSYDSAIVTYHIRMDLTCLLCAVLAVCGGLLLYVECMWVMG